MERLKVIEKFSARLRINRNRIARQPDSFWLRDEDKIPTVGAATNNSPRLLASSPEQAISITLDLRNRLAILCCVVRSFQTSRRFPFDDEAIVNRVGTS